MCEVTVVIPNYNGKKYLCPCLEALYMNTVTEIKVLVIDNCSKDGSIEEAKQRFPQAEYLLLEKNYGFCRAVNIGIKRSRTPYVILLNNDTEIKEGFVEALLKAVKQNDRIFSVESKMIQYGDQSLIDSAGTFYNALGWAFARGKDKKVDQYKKGCRTFAACAGAAIYRKSVFDKIGLFDELHFAYMEDIDVGYRARLQGYINMYEPNAEVIHVGSAASGSRYNEFKTKYSARNNVYMIYKNMPFLQIVLNAPFLLAGFAVKTAFFFRKGYGTIYLKGLKDGLGVCRKDKIVKFDKKNLINYVQVQLELWGNVIRRFFSG